MATRTPSNKNRGTSWLGMITRSTINLVRKSVTSSASESPLKRKRPTDDESDNSAGDDEVGLVPLLKDVTLKGLQAVDEEEPAHDSQEDDGSPTLDEVDEDEDEDYVQESMETSDSDRRSDDSHSDGPPSMKQFARLKKRYSSAPFEDGSGTAGARRFHVNSEVYVRPEGVTFKKGEVHCHNLWVARVVDIRDDKRDNTWVKVVWFYNGKQLEEEMKTMKSSHTYSPKAACGKYELISTDHEDIIDYRCCESTPNVTFLKDGNLAQNNPPVHYVRTKYNFWKVCLTAPVSTCDIGKQCKNSYNPDTDVQHYCAPCDRWFHDKCMEDAKWRLLPGQIKKLVQTPERLRGGALPTPRHVAELVSTYFARQKKLGPQAKKRRVEPVQARATRSGTKAQSQSHSPTKGKGKGSKSPLVQILSTIEAVAGRQIVRGGGQTYGVVGNAKLVCGARLILKDFKTGRRTKDNWDADLDPDWLAELQQQSETAEDSGPYYQCRNCKNLL